MIYKISFLIFGTAYRVILFWKSDVEALVQDAVNVIKNKIEDEKEMLTISEAAEYLQIS